MTYELSSILIFYASSSLFLNTLDVCVRALSCMFMFVFMHMYICVLMYIFMFVYDVHIYVFGHVLMYV